MNTNRAAFIAALFALCTANTDRLQNRLSQHAVELKEHVDYGAICVDSECAECSQCNYEQTECIAIADCHPSGCCKGDSASTNTRCNLHESDPQCSRMSSCHWMNGDDADCSYPPTQAPEDPGCCFVMDEYLGTSWETYCTDLYTESECVPDYEDDNRCTWSPQKDGFDCSQIWPTPAPESGCCSGTSYTTALQCGLRGDESACERIASCFWIVTDDDADCEIAETTESPPEPGCCEISDYGTVSTSWIDQCHEFYDEDDCLRPLSDNMSRCKWTPAPAGYDCAYLWPTTASPTTTSETGCCAGDSERATDKCNDKTTMAKCQIVSSCYWVLGGDAYSADCAWVATREPIDPGCCYGNPSAYSAKWQETCTQFYEERDCLQLTDDSGAFRCFWEGLGDEYGNHGDDYDCSLLWPTTTTSTEEPGCCKGDSYMIPAQQTLCMGLRERDDCSLRGCVWLYTTDVTDCAMPTTTNTPTTTEELGCCGAYTQKEYARCGAETTKNNCDRSSSCYWNVGEYADCSMPSTTEEPGCCFGNADVTYSVKWQEACTGFYVERECMSLLDEESGAPRCTWQDLIEGYDCSILWPTTTTTTETPGCCKGSSYKAQAKCEGLSDRLGCERQSCEWLETDEPKDCVITTSSTTSTTVEPGCCAGDSKKENDKCNAKVSEKNCDKISSCHWKSGATADCSLVTTTVEPGCCYVNPNVAYSAKWQDSCVGFFAERECLQLTNSNGATRCHWEPLGDGYDCSQLWPTTTTTTETPGCCKGLSFSSAAQEKCCVDGWSQGTDCQNGCYNCACSDGSTQCGCVHLDNIDERDLYKSQAKCLGFELEDCERRGCEWVETDDANDCVITTTSTTSTTDGPGCCAGNNARTSGICNMKPSEDKCDRSSNCHWEAGEDAICDFTTTEEPGCCYGNPDAAYSKRWMEACIIFYTDRDCLRLVDSDGGYRCRWESLGDEYDCSQLWPTTTTTTIMPGCCKGSSYKAQAKCLGFEQDDCARRGCEWVETDNLNDCVLTTTSTTTTTAEPGCCAGLSMTATGKCNTIALEDRCNDRSSCYWMATSNYADCEFVTSTEESGCCFGNPDAAYSTRWQTVCTGFYTERDCVRILDDSDAARCQWEPLGEYMDCKMLWPTTTSTTVAPGCCGALHFKSLPLCQGARDDRHCDSMAKCFWIETDDADDCLMTTTTTTSTTAEPGCCAGDSIRATEKCGAMELEDRCNERASCHWRVGEDADCSWDPPSTTAESGCCYESPYAAYSSRWMAACTAFLTERDCLHMIDENGAVRCHWDALPAAYDCSLLWPTTTTTTLAPGCCMGSSYKSNAKCFGIAEQMGCERMDCLWLDTDEPKDCVLTTTTTTTTTDIPGCCAGDSFQATERCANIEESDRCNERSECHWNVGEYADCSMPSTTEEPGCCFGNPDAAYSAKWQDLCVEFYVDRECLQMTDSDGEPRCHWEPMDGGYDCSQLWPTTTTTTEAPGCCTTTSDDKGYMMEALTRCIRFPDAHQCERMDCKWIETDDASDCVITTTSTTEEPGCCKADAERRQDMCDNRGVENHQNDWKKKCDKISSCHWLSGTEAVCEWDDTTTTIDPGCCFGNPAVAYSSKWMDTCTDFYDATHCLTFEDGAGNKRCAWQDITEGYDCSILWPTTTTTTEAAGCCKGSSYKAQAKCEDLSDRLGCERQSCEWLETDEPKDCVITTTSTTSTTEEPGCCKADAPLSQELCDGRSDSADKCNRAANCHYIFGVDADCSNPPTTTIEPGCCYGNPDSAYSQRWMEMCVDFFSEVHCVQILDGEGAPRCHWESITDEMYDCAQLWPTTTTTTTAPGCCRGSVYKQQAKCVGLADEFGCERMDCEWFETDDASDCVLTTSSTTESAGCCAGDSAKSNDKCNAKADHEKCDRSSSCHWIVTDDVAECAWTVTTTAEPGCCYGNVDAAYSTKWMEACTGFYAERDCLLLSNDAVPRCTWEAKGDNYDCAQLWPTTTSTTVDPGCCRGTSSRSHDKCFEEPQGVCERMQNCEWLLTDDAVECAMTVEPTTTSDWMMVKPEQEMEEEMVVAGHSESALTMQSEVSLSTVLLLMAAAFVAYFVYRSCSKNNKVDGYTQLVDGPEAVTM